ncbi:hypothetical protein HHK36_014356 [Tetracentron sinense]|uniref:Nuclear transcription factor Y subunit n=1 Tax=Tetracentron sinense TaxID=13715 RepID=A0A835DF45_TETSI|nr:hypothetical protein HHK36_014356 [Tetracentron sinense]
MQNMPKRDSDQSSVHSTSPCIISCPSWWNTTESHIPQSALSKSLSLKMGSPPQQCAKQLGLQLQDQDSSSTRSTGESLHEVAAMGGSNPYGQYILSQSGCKETYGRRVEGHIKSALSVRNLDFVLSPSQVDYSQSMARIPYPYVDPYCGGLFSAYGPQAIIHPQIVGMAPARVPLPLDLAEDEPIYVNAKQYRGILRRRQSRAKLEAKNKLVKDRKPYLHESRHLHALRRVRGSGGRFVDTKKLQESGYTPTTNTQDVSDSDLAQLQLGGNLSESEVHQSETSKGCASYSDVANSDDMFRQSDLRFSGYHSHVGGTMQGGGGFMRNGTQHRVSVLR